MPPVEVLVMRLDFGAVSLTMRRSFSGISSLRRRPFGATIQRGEVPDPLVDLRRILPLAVDPLIVNYRVVGRTLADGMVTDGSNIESVQGTMQNVMPQVLE